VSVERGVDPAGLALVAFGGAGPLHACALAESLGMAAVIVPAAAGVLSAVGLLVSRRRAEQVRSWPTPGDAGGLDGVLAELAASVLAELGDPTATVSTFLDCRYAGQSHELRVASVDEFPDEHERRNGFRRQDGTPVEVVALRAVAEGAIMVAHNASFENGFLGAELERAGGAWGLPRLCTVRLSQRLHGAVGRDLAVLVAAHAVGHGDEHAAVLRARARRGAVAVPPARLGALRHASHGIPLCEHALGVARAFARPDHDEAAIGQGGDLGAALVSIGVAVDREFIAAGQAGSPGYVTGQPDIEHGQQIVGIVAAVGG
jgi:hypothetical protein